MSVKKLMAATLALALLTACSGGNAPQGSEPSTGGNQTMTQADNPQFAEANGPTAVIKTNMGEITVQLYPDEAPKAVENFLTHAKNGYYDGVIFHRVINDFMIQGGDPTGTGRGGESIWGGSFEDEFSAKLHNFRGALSMANSGTNTNGSQFFIVQASSCPSQMIDSMKAVAEQDGGESYSEAVIAKYQEIGGTPWLDYKHSVFGQVFSGMDIVDEIVAQAKNTDQNGMVDEGERVLIESITVAPAADYFEYAE